MLAISLTQPPSVIDEATYRIGAVASTQSVDGQSEIVMASGIDLSRVTRGQVKLLDSHNKKTITAQLGNVELAMLRDGNALHTEMVYAVGISPLAEFAWKMTRGKFLSGFSIGFLPKVVATLDDVKSEGRVAVKANPALWRAACERMGIDPKDTAERASRIVVKSELIELSACCTPVNPDAMTKALAAGAIGEEDIASIGLADEWDLIAKGADAWEAMHPSQRDAFKSLLTSMAHKNFAGKETGAASADKAQRRAAEAEKDHRRAELLSACETLAAKLASVTRRN